MMPHEFQLSLLPVDILRLIIIHDFALLCTLILDAQVENSRTLKSFVGSLTHEPWLNISLPVS